MENEQKSNENNVEFEIEELGDELDDVAGGACGGCDGCSHGGCTTCSAIE